MAVSRYQSARPDDATMLPVPAADTPQPPNLQNLRHSVMAEIMMLANVLSNE